MLSDGEILTFLSVTDAYQITSSVSTLIEREHVTWSLAQMRPRARVVSCTSSVDALDALDAPKRPFSYLQPKLGLINCELSRDSSICNESAFGWLLCVVIRRMGCGSTPTKFVVKTTSCCDSNKQVRLKRRF